MAALVFPSSPTVGQLYPTPAIAGIAQWQWDGTRWLVVAGGNTIPYSQLPPEVQQVPITFPFVGKVPVSVDVFIPIVSSLAIPANFAGSLAFCAAASEATAAAAFSVLYSPTMNPVSWTTVGTITFSPGSQIGVFSTSVAVTMAVGGLFAINPPNPQDATLGNVGITILTMRQ